MQKQISKNSMTPPPKVTEKYLENMTNILKLNDILLSNSWVKNENVKIYFELNKNQNIKYHQTQWNAINLGKLIALNAYIGGWFSNKCSNLLP